MQHMSTILKNREYEFVYVFVCTIAIDILFVLHLSHFSIYSLPQLFCYRFSDSSDEESEQNDDDANASEVHSAPETSPTQPSNR